MKNLSKFYIAGEWVNPVSDNMMPVLNPATEEQIGTVALGNTADVDNAVAAAKSAFNSFSLMSKADRLGLLNELKRLTEKRFEDLAQAMRMEMGAPITMARDAQADAAIGHLQGYIEALETLEERYKLSNSDILIREPIGVCGLITPWNWPINQIALKVIPALATGCTCILKPSEHTPISAMVYTEIIHEAGYPPGVFNLIHGLGETVGSAMSRHPDIQMMSFTGSTRAGVEVARNAAPTVKRVAQELGGKSANIILDDADIEKAAGAGANHCFMNTGQSCNAPTRMLVSSNNYEKAVESAAAVANSTVVGSPEDEGVKIGPISNKVQYEKVQRLIQIGIDEGARLVAGGLGRPDGITEGYFVKPTVFADVTNDMTIAKEEIFGPVLSILKYESEDEAIEIANDTEYGLAGYVQSGDEDHAKQVARRIRAGQISINGGSRGPAAPFGGFKTSGNGREHGLAGLSECLETKAIIGN